MEILSRYKAIDGSIFDSESKCLAYELLIARVNIIMSKLAPLPKDKGSRFANGKGYIQQSKDIVETAKKEFVKLVNEYLKTEDRPYGFGFLGRVLDDSDIRCLYSAWGRFACMDNQYREWGQQYYAVNPSAGVQSPYTDEQ